MKKFILFFIIIGSILNGCGGIDESLNTKYRVFNKKNSSIKEKKVLFLESNETKDIDNIENNNKKSKQLVKVELKSQKQKNELDNLVKFLNKLNLNVNIKEIHLKKGNLLLTNLGPIIHFETNKFDIKKKYRPKLNKIIDVLKKDKNFILIVGHTDSVGSDVYNQKLSELRAREVYNYCIFKGINKKRIDYIGYGEEQPIATNATPEGRAKNRRVELLISNDENLSNYFLEHRQINKMYLNNHNFKLAGKVIVTKKGWSKELSNTEIKKLESKFSQPRREELIPRFQKRELKIHLKKRELIFKGEK